jgi:DNA processing protein
VNATQVPGWLDPQDDRTARAAWSRLAEPGDRAAGRVVARLGAGPALLSLLRSPRDLDAAAAGTATGPGQEGSPTARWRVRWTDLNPVRDLATVRRFGGRLLIPGDPQWPVALDHLQERAPFALWVRGPLDLASTGRRSVSLVGCRACSGYGEHVATELGAGCADRGITVVSGAAYGIDAATHRGALTVGGSTIAVLACGVDRPYPRGNERLIERIAVEGAVISEVPPGSSPTRWRFVQRNRMIAALSPVTVVVEAAWRSGASITASEAAALGREVGAVPGPVTSAASAGCHRLLREGATCVTDAAEIAELVCPIGQQEALPPAVPAAEYDGLDPVDLKVLDALPIRRPAPMAALVRTAGLDEQTVRASVGRLELRGLAAGTPQGWQRVRPKPDRAAARWSAKAPRAVR